MTATVLMIAQQQANATIHFDGNADAQGIFNACSFSFGLPGNDPDGSWAEVVGSPTDVPVLQSGVRVISNHKNFAVDSGDHPYIGWAPLDTTPLSGDGTPKEACAELYHEVTHMAEYLSTGQVNRNHCFVSRNGQLVDTGIKITEIRATRAENDYRTRNGLPARTTYGKTPLPMSNEQCFDPQLPRADPFPSVVLVEISYIDDSMGGSISAQASVTYAKHGPCAIGGNCTYLIRSVNGQISGSDRFKCTFQGSGGGRPTGSATIWSNPAPVGDGFIYAAGFEFEKNHPYQAKVSRAI